MLRYITFVYSAKIIFARRSTEDALKRMAKRAKQLEAEAADLQACWDAERRDLLRRELLTSQICDAMVPHLRPGCPFRDVAAVRSTATWSDELGRWRLPDATPYISLPPASLAPKDNIQYNVAVPSKPDLNNNSNNEDNVDEIDVEAENEESSEQERAKKLDIVDTYFRRNRIDKLLAHAREAKTFGKQRCKNDENLEDIGRYISLIEALAFFVKPLNPSMRDDPVTRRFYLLFLSVEQNRKIRFPYFFSLYARYDDANDRVS